MRFSSGDLKARLQAHSKENYLFIYSVMKGAVVGVAVFILINILHNAPAGYWVFWCKLSLWAASFAAIIMTYYATTVGTLIWVFYPAWRDIVLPFLLVVAECFLFLVLIKPDQTSSYPTDMYWQHWNLAFAVFAFVCHLMLRNIYRRVRPEDYEEEFGRLINNYRRQVNHDRWSSGLSAIFWLIVWVIWYFVLINHHPGTGNWQCLSGITVLVLMVFVTRNQEKERKIIIEAITREE